ncbi:hypothetical protein QBC44DRAFT_343416 [Cladorrhinum sp. PSN332]|nr:hypothetical protein QBC44DRAFT_343416 [Cladorrhinum sp. PSN332]
MTFKKALNYKYNTLLNNANQPPIANQHITNLANIFVKHNAHEVLGIHLIHGHFKIPSNAVILGTNIDESAIHRPLPDLSSVSQGFLSEFVEYIVNNNLTSLIRLQVLSYGHKQSTIFKLILDQGTIMLDASIAKNIVPTRITS